MSTSRGHLSFWGDSRTHRRSAATRTGRYEHQQEGYDAFILHPLPLSEPPDINRASRHNKSAAETALRTLGQVWKAIPYRENLKPVLAAREAVYSCRIENIESNITEVLMYDYYRSDDRKASHDRIKRVLGTREAQLYTDASVSPDVEVLNLENILDIHRSVLPTGLDDRFTPGEVRTVQNWIGTPGSTPHTAIFVPPPARKVAEGLADFIEYTCRSESPALTRIALGHAQFETIHPFLDGNGRAGRALIDFTARRLGMAEGCSLDMSSTLWDYRPQYYEGFRQFRTGDVSGWLNFFYDRVAAACREKVSLLIGIREMHEGNKRLIADQMGSGVDIEARVLDTLLSSPVILSSRLSKRLGASPKTITSVLTRLEELELVRIQPGLRYKPYVYSSYVEKLESWTQ